MKRLCIYLLYDERKIIDQYIGYMLNELKTCIDHVIVVCNMPEVVSGIENLEKYADEVFYRRNIGFDAGGFKEAMCSFIGWNKIWEYDELVLANDSMFGPFIPMKCIFSEMDNYSVDFWGLAKQGERGGKGVRGFQEYIQSYFLVIRSVMLHDIRFREYWEDMPFYEQFWDVVIQYEEKFTSYFKEMGYTYDALAETKVNDSKFNLSNNYSQYATISYELIRKRNFPFLKKQQMAYNTLSKQTQENLYQALSYIDKETDYDVNLIWDNIIRTLNMTDLQRSLHLQYIISSEKKKLTDNRRVAIIIYAEYKEATEYVLEYLDKLTPGSTYFVQIVSKKDIVLKAYEKERICGRNIHLEKEIDVPYLCTYNFVCFLHDTDMTSDINPSCMGKSYFYCIWENLFKNENHILGILEKFEKESRLGFLAPPSPNFADYFGELGSGWKGNYEIVKGIAERLHLHCPISEEKPPFRATEDFWIRGNILKQFMELETNERQYVPYLWSYFAQDMGYYSGIVESTEYASMNEVNLNYYLDRIASQIKYGYGNFDSFSEMEEKLLSEALTKFCEKHSRILIYGTGYYAKKYKDFLKNVEACVVSDGQNKADYFEGFPVMYLSEVLDLNKYGVVLCLNKKNQEQALVELKKYGACDWYCIPC